jgi:hypothetical protein
MTELVASGRGIDLALAVLLLEAVLLALIMRRRRPRLSAADWAYGLLAGVFLLLALRAAVSGLGTAWIAVALGAALVAHALDLRQRLGAPGR